MSMEPITVPEEQDQPQAASAPAQDSIPMISEDFSQSKLVPKDQMDSARQAGWQEAVKMIGPKGEKKVVPYSQVEDARTHQFAITPDTPGVHRMVTADGQVTYALPSEVDQFKATGHTLIHPDGNFQVQPIQVRPNHWYQGGMETPDETEARAVNVAKALGDEQMKKSVAAEQKYWTSKEGLKEEAKGLGNVALVGGGTMAGIAGPGMLMEGASAAHAALPLIRAALPAAESVETALKVARILKDLSLGTGSALYIYRLLKGK